MRNNKNQRNLNIDLGNNPFQDESQIKIKTFQTSTKSNLDKKSQSVA